MRQILALAVCGLSLAACTSSDLFRLDHPQVTLQLESEPAGAEAKVSTGATCKTPCSVPVEGNGEMTVTYTLEGYEPQQVAVQVIPPLDPREGPARVTPNPVRAQLAAMAKPTTRRAVKRRPAAKKPAAKKPASAAKKPAAKRPSAKKPAAKQPAATPPAPEPAPATTTAPTAPPPAAAAPPPMPTTPPPASPASPWPTAPGQPPAQQ